MIDCEGLKERLNKKLDMALEVAKCRKEVWETRNLEEDDNYHWSEIDLAKKILLFECSHFIDEIYKNENNS